MTVMEQAPAGAVRPTRRGHRRGMSPVEAIMVALQGLVANKLRSILTMLGIIIGVASVILTIALGQGAAAASQAIIAQMGTNVLSVYPNSQPRTGPVSGGVGSAVNVRREDPDSIHEACPYV